MPRLVLLPVLVVALLVTATSVHAGVPLVTSYQGRLLDASDQPVSGTFNMVFQIFDVPTGGTPLWTEDKVGVQVTDGLFTVALGSTVPLSSDLLAGSGGGGGGVTRYLQIQVLGQPPISPRTPLASAPSAVVASSVYSESTSGVARSKGIISTKPNTGNPNGFILLDADSDGDGIPEYIVTDSVSTDGASRRLRSYGIGSSGQDGVEVQLSAHSKKGIVESRASQNSQSLRFASGADSAAATTLLEADTDGDGVPEGDISSSVTPTTSSMAIKTKGTGADKDRVMSITATTDGFSSAVHRSDYDDDGDGVPEQEISQVLSPATSMVAIKTKGTGAANNRSSIISTSGLDSATVVTSHDSDGDGIPDAVVTSSVGGITGGAVAGRIAIKTKGTAADGNRSMSITATTNGFSSAVHRSDYDDDGDGVPEQEISQTVLPTTSSVAIRAKGTGADKDRVISSTTDTSKAVTVHSADIDGDGVADRVIREQCDDDDASITVARADGEIKIKHKGWDGTIKGRMAIEEGGAIKVDFAGDGVGFVSQRFGIGVLSPTNPIEHSSGAHLTAGGVWTNASDANLKENFQPVDGAELLEKIEQLPISEWNYKTESDEIKHIGPTAQDFQKVFGVGENDKTISTIDPSGIALAAIKQLRRENTDLQDKVAQLQALVEKLLAEKK